MRSKSSESVMRPLRREILGQTAWDFAPENKPKCGLCGWPLEPETVHDAICRKLRDCYGKEK